MNRAMFAGVAGLKTHQTKMDVIGNNIANVNTYGYKAQRAVFSDVYYQTLRAASQGDANQGGTNPSSVGYGSTLTAIQAQMTTSSMQTTGFGLDAAIAGEGFFQVMDPDGNIFYTKAGLLDYDANGYLIDINGNFVLGTTDPNGNPDTQKLKLDDIGAVPAKAPSVESMINGITYTIEATNATEYGNVSITISSSDQLPAGLPAEASISSTGAILINLNAYETFTDFTALNNAINNAITEANGGVEHVAGDFEIAVKDAAVNPFPAGGLTGAEIVGTAGGVNKGSISPSSTTLDLFGGSLKILEVSSDFSPLGTTVDAANFTATYIPAAGAVPQGWNISMDIGGTIYSGIIREDTQASSVLLSSPNGDYIEVSNPTFKGIADYYTDEIGAAPTLATDTITAFDAAAGNLNVTPSVPSPNLGLASEAFTLEGGTEGGAVTLNQLSNIAIAPNGLITVTHAELGNVTVGKLSLATFANPSGLLLEGSNYYSQTVNSGEPELTDPGSDGTGALKTSSLEMSNVDLSEQFAEMITTQRGFQANSRIITVTDTMLEELINLKR